MFLNELEVAAIKKFFESEQIASKTDLITVPIIARDITPIGFFTVLEPYKVPISNFKKAFIGGRIGAIINNSIDVGFVMSVKDGYFEAVEGHTFNGELWPEKIDSFEIYLINYQKLGPEAD